MAELFRMPQASPTMTVGVVARWLVAEGAELAPQTAIAQVETDKATMDVEVFDRGFLLRRLVPEGAEVPPGAPIAILGQRADEDVSALLAEVAALAAAPPATPAAAPVAVPVPAPVPAPASEPPSPAPTTPASAPTPAPVPAAPPAVAAAAPAEPGRAPPLLWKGQRVDDSIMEPRGAFRPPGPRLFASPLARTLAAERGIELRRVRGSGPGGRIVAADVESAATNVSARPAPAARADAPRRVTQMRKTIARRLLEAHQQVPVFYLTVTFDVSAFVALKAEGEKRGLKFSYNDLLLRAVAQALRDVPAVNAQWAGDTIVEKASVDIGVAVALPDGLVTPVVRNADTKSVSAIAAEVRELAGRAKEGKLAPEEYTGGTFTVSNLGMFGIEHFTAILNPPEAAILAVGSVAEVPVVRGGRLEVGWRMKTTLTCDHRVVDGALGARFLAALRSYVETPALLVLA